MHKKRLIFTLLYADGYFMLSRNFTLQRVGDAQWLKKNYNFQAIASSIDELVILDISRNLRDRQKFIKNLHQVIDNVFVPVAIGGGVCSFEEASLLLSEGADKLILNSVLHSDPNLIRDLIDQYGSQCIVASVDYKFIDGILSPFINNGMTKLQYSLEKHLINIYNLNVGELLINSIGRDGTGQGYEIATLKKLIDNSNIPVIITGGAGKKEHFFEALSEPFIDAVSTAHLFNFMGNGFPLSLIHI